MSWAQKYRSTKDTNRKKGEEFGPLEHFKIYSEQIEVLYKRIKEFVSGTIIQVKTSSILVPKNPKDPFMKEKENLNSLVLADNENEFKIIPDGINYIGVLGRVSLKAYQKVYAYNSIIEKKINAFDEPYLFLVHNIKSEPAYSWGYLTAKGDKTSSFSRISSHEIKFLTDEKLELLLDDVFLS